MNQFFTHWIESDAYDRNAFAALRADSASLQGVEASGTRLLPHFDGFLLDLFALLFKLNVVFHREEDVAPSAGFYRVLLDHVHATPALEVVRRQTVLDETTAGLATLLLAERLLDLLKSERLLTRTSMLDFWNMSQREEEIAAQAAEAETAEMLQREVAGRPAERRLGELRNRLRRDALAGQRRLTQQARQVQSGLAEAAERERARVQAQLHHVAAELEAAREESESWSVHLGGGSRSAPGAQIELGHRLARNPKLRRMAQLVGRMRESARALRGSWYERGNTDLYEVGIGAELSHLLPPELLGLRHPVLRRDFARRLLDRALLVYALRAPTEQGRGPMIVCLDGSSSMAGDKEIWSKAVTLTLLDIARRQRRRFRWICFASAETPLAVHDLNPGQRYATDLPEVFEIAEYFPGGGTDFQKPLAAALDCLRRARHKRGDIVFITDGECRVDPDWLEQFKREKTALGFSLFSVLIDVGSSSLGALKELSDKITSVTQLTSEATKDIFLRV